MAKTNIEKFFGNRYVQFAALAAGAISVWRAFHHPQGAEGVGKVLESDFDGALVTTKDGRHAVDFRVNGDDSIIVTAMMYAPEQMRYGSDWDYWFHIGDYTTLAGAKRGAKRAMQKMGYELSDKDLNKI